MKFIHTADIHLGAAPDAGYPWSEKRKKEIWDSFQRLIQIVKAEKVELLLIAGDLFHRQPLLRELKEVDYLFSTIPDTQVVLIAGNHDYLKTDSYYRRYPWSENVLGLWGDALQEVYLPKVSAWIYGFSYHSREITERKLQNIQPNGKQGYHILLAHGGDDKHVPIMKNDIIQSGFDYIALGHIHRPGQILPDKAIYSGALEPLDRNDIGTHGYIMGNFSKNGVQTKFISHAVRSYAVLEIETDRNMTQYALEEQMKNAITEAGTENIYKVILKGFRTPDTVFHTEYLYDLGNLVEIEDMTKPDYDMGKLRERYAGSLIGEYIGRFLESEDPIEKKALYYGLHALLEVKG